MQTVDELVKKWDDALAEIRARVYYPGNEIPTYRDLMQALNAMLDWHRLDGGCTDEGCGCVGSVAQTILDAARNRANR